MRGNLPAPALLHQAPLQRMRRADASTVQRVTQTWRGVVGRGVAWRGGAGRVAEVSGGPAVQGEGLR